mmetsp:Transcript_33338/g.78102  ORF Transcript_33338/g.78102 Transcript_33338/m.78102 type:complete len:246 (-) Transcript_33338:582-1319(-)
MRTEGTSAKRWMLLLCTTYPCAMTGGMRHAVGSSTTFLTILTMCSCVVGMCCSLENSLSSSDPTAWAMCAGMTFHAVSVRKGPNEMWLTLCDTSMVAQLNSCPSLLAWIVIPPGALCTCSRPAMRQPTPMWLSASPSSLWSTAWVLGAFLVAWSTKCLAQLTIEVTLLSPWYLSWCASLRSSRRKTMMVGNASMRLSVHSLLPSSPEQSTEANLISIRSSSSSLILPAASSHTGSSFWHQWHHGV